MTYRYDRLPGSAGVQRGAQAALDRLLNEALDDARHQRARALDAYAAYRERRAARETAMAEARAEARARRQRGVRA